MSHVQLQVNRNKCPAGTICGPGAPISKTLVSRRKFSIIERYFQCRRATESPHEESFGLMIWSCPKAKVHIEGRLEKMGGDRGLEPRTR
jgi:hypothetical protein